MSTKTEKLNKRVHNGYCEYRPNEGWYWRQTPNGDRFGPSYPGIWLGENFNRAMDYFDIKDIEDEQGGDEWYIEGYEQ